MPRSPLATVVGRLIRDLPPADGTADDALLARFVGWRDEAAFELLVYRHGPMVRGLCRRILRHEQDAEDAFQGTFLALAKKASTVGGKSLPGWLYRVAFHAALKAKAFSVRREASLPEIAGPVRTDELHDRELRAVLDEEIVRLPERFRLPVVLCYVQGRSNSEAAAALGVPKGTIDSRLSTARQRLRVRLARRGLVPAVAGAAFDKMMDSVSEATELPGSVARAVAKAAVAFTSNQAGVPAAAAVLAEGVLHTMFLTNLKWAVAAALALAVLGSGAGVATYGVLADGPPAAVADNQSKPSTPVAEPDKDVSSPVAEKSKPTASGFASLCEGLQRPITVEGLEGIPLKDALAFLSDRTGLTFIIDNQAFNQLGVANVEETQVRLPKMPNVSLGTVLRFLLNQVEATYLVRRDYIEITTNQRKILHAFGSNEGASIEMLPPTVNVVFQARPLDRALDDLVSQTGVNIVLDQRVADKDRLKVTAQLVNTPVDAAVRVLADMADLESVKVGNIFYVTTKANAARLQKEKAEP
jgi:RNA polymerase sigma factor (sigma-70 family)